MFTGIIEQAGTLVSLEQRGGVRRITVEAPELAARMREGDSLGVSGVCLTALDVDPTYFMPIWRRKPSIKPRSAHLPPARR
jgi:riboflavin synthase